MELRQKRNDELFTLYEGELAFRHRSAKAIREAKRVLKHFHEYLGEFPPTPELAKSFLANFAKRKPTTLARYVAELKLFLKWYGEDLDIKINVPKTLPSYVEKADIEKLLDAIKSKKNHKKTISRDILLIDLAIHTGLRRTELANLKIGDIDLERQVLVVRQGKGAKDRVIPLSKNTIEKLAIDIKDKDKESSLFNLKPASISGKIKTFAVKAGIGIHTHSLRDYFATSLSEKGATIREIQSLLGHTNLTHTERYTLHTDKHLKKAIELIDQEPQEEPRKLPDKSQPIVIIKVINKKTWPDDDNVIRSDYFSHFLVRNDGEKPIVELEMCLLDNKQKLLEAHKEIVLGAKEEVVFKPMVKPSDGTYYLVCQYKSIDSEEINRVSLPFQLDNVNDSNNILVAPRELKLEFDLSKEKMLKIFMDKPN